MASNPSLHPPISLQTDTAAVLQPLTHEKKARLEYVEPIRAYAMSIVVLIHVAAILAPHFKTIEPGTWWIALFYHVLSKGGPPIFTIVSGALLLGVPSDQPLSVFFKKRFLKVLIPFIGWAVVYLAWRVWFKGEAMTPEQMIGAFLAGTVYDHLWFIQMILGLYLATPILRVYVQQANRANLRYFLIVWFIGIACLPTIARLLNVEIKLDLVVTTGYVGYFVCGYYLRDFVLKPKHFLPVLLVVVVTIVFTEYTTYALMIDHGKEFDPWFLNNQGFNVFIIALGMFVYLKSIPWSNLFDTFPPLRRLVTLLASCSLGVYFIHMLIMELLGSGRLGFKVDSFTIHPLIGIPLTACITFIISILVVRIMKMIPILKIFVP